MMPREDDLSCIFTALPSQQDYLRKALAPLFCSACPITLHQSLCSRSNFLGLQIGKLGKRFSVYLRVLIKAIHTVPNKGTLIFLFHSNASLPEQIILPVMEVPPSYLVPSKVVDLKMLKPLKATVSMARHFLVAS